MRLYVDDELTHVTQSCIALDSSLTCSDLPLLGTQKQKPLPFWPYPPLPSTPAQTLSFARCSCAFGVCKFWERSRLCAQDVFCKMCVCVITDCIGERNVPLLHIRGYCHIFSVLRHAQTQRRQRLLTRLV